MKKRVPLTVLTIIFCSFLAQGQYYNRQAGVRSGAAGGIFIQYSDASGTAENGFFGMITFRKNGLQVTGLRIFYETTLSEVSPDLYFTWGYGGHAGFMITDNLSFLGQDYYFRGERFCPLIGIDGWAGLEYRFNSIPLSIGLNMKPWLEITFPSFVSFMPVELGLTIAYRF